MPSGNFAPVTGYRYHNTNLICWSHKSIPLVLGQSKDDGLAVDSWFDKLTTSGLLPCLAELVFLSMRPEGEMEGKTLEELESLAGSALETAAAQLHGALLALAARLDPFPRFLNMATIQAVELEPPLRPAEDRGCVVVCPDGEIRRLELAALPGAEGVSDVEQVEQFRELDLPVEEYIVYASAAIQVLSAELRRRRGSARLTGE